MVERTGVPQPRLRRVSPTTFLAYPAITDRSARRKRITAPVPIACYSSTTPTSSAQLPWIVIWPVGCDFCVGYDDVITMFDDSVWSCSKLFKEAILQMKFTSHMS